MIRRKRLLVKFEKYGILFIHEGHIELGQKIVVKYLLKNLNGMNNATKRTNVEHKKLNLLYDYQTVR